jgi:hypothetical protein
MFLMELRIGRNFDDYDATTALTGAICVSIASAASAAS